MLGTLLLVAAWICILIMAARLYGAYTAATYFGSRAWAIYNSLWALFWAVAATALMIGGFHV